MLSLIFATLTTAAFADLTCFAGKSAECVNCKTNISVSCQNDTYKGFAEKSTRPTSLTLAISNPNSGSVKIIEIPNTKTLENLTSNLSYEQDTQIVEEIKKKNFHINKNMKIDLLSFKLSEKATLYTTHEMKKSVALNKSLFKKQSRSVASEPTADSVGGIRRAIDAEKAQ